MGRRRTSDPGDSDWWAGKPAKWRHRHGLPLAWQLAILIAGGVLVGALTAWRGP